MTIILIRQPGCQVARGREGRLAQLVRAPRLHRGGRRFESCTAHHLEFVCSGDMGNGPAGSASENTPEALFYVLVLHWCG
jgi:hypothetical protein